MTRKRIYRVIIAAAIVALSGLLCIQIFWFISAYRLQERQFNEKVNIALRSIADKLLTLNSDSSSKINPVEQTASNAFHVDLNHTIRYSALDSLLKLTFAEHGIHSAFEVTIYDHELSTIFLGNRYQNGIESTAQPTCMEREPAQAKMDFVITFPNKAANIIQSMQLWIFTALTFSLILILFAFMIIDLSKQKNLAEMKTDFINNMTHELQTPLSNISIASEVLRGASTKMDAVKIQQYANIIYDENQRLKQHVEQVLQTALLEKNEIELKKKQIDINTLIREVLRNFQVRIEQRQGIIASRFDADQPKVFGDPFHLTNVIYSLLDNAEKYSPDNPQITITTKNEGPNIFICVADKGIGISKEVQRYIFDKFYRAPTGNVHTIKGFGLGLTYVQKIVKAHQGDVRVTSSLNQGSVFELHFPIYS